MSPELKSFFREGWSLFAIMLFLIVGGLWAEFRPVTISPDVTDIELEKIGRACAAESGPELFREYGRERCSLVHRALHPSAHLLADEVLAAQMIDGNCRAGGPYCEEVAREIARRLAMEPESVLHLEDMTRSRVEEIDQECGRSPAAEKLLNYGRGYCAAVQKYRALRYPPPR